MDYCSANALRGQDNYVNMYINYYDNFSGYSNDVCNFLFCFVTDILTAPAVWTLLNILIAPAVWTLLKLLHYNTAELMN